MDPAAISAEIAGCTARATPLAKSIPICAALVQVLQMNTKESTDHAALGSGVNGQNGAPAAETTLAAIVGWYAAETTQNATLLLHLAVQNQPQATNIPEPVGLVRRQRRRQQP